MKRFTTRDEKGKAWFACWGDTIKDDIEQLDYQQEEWLDALADKLAEYEDLEEAGRLVKLPYKIGDTVYWLTRDKKIVNLNIIKFVIYGLNSDPTFVAEYTQDGLERTDYFNFGKTVFLTREEAEAALKGADK